MTFRVIEGGGAPAASAIGSVEEARSEIIDRVASCIWSFQDESPDPAYVTWAELKALAKDDPSRQHLVRTTLRQARAAIAGLKSLAVPSVEWVLCDRLGLNPEEFADVSLALDLFVDEVLK